MNHWHITDEFDRTTPGSGCGYVANSQAINKAFIEAGRYEIDIVGERVPAKAFLRPAYDPKRA